MLHNAHIFLASRESLWEIEETSLNLDTAGARLFLEVVTHLSSGASGTWAFSPDEAIHSEADLEQGF